MKKYYLLLYFFAINTAFAAQAIQITQASQLLPGAHAVATTGDYLIENDSVKFIISNISHVLSPSNTGGLCIDAAPQGGLDDFDLLYLYLNDQWPRQADYSSLEIVSAGTPNDSAHIRVRGVDSYNSSVAISTDYILYDHSASLKIKTRITNNSSSALSDFGIGDAFSWGSEPFVPGGASTADWLASKTPNSVYGYYAPIPFYAIHGSYWSDVTLDYPTLAPGTSTEALRYFCAGNSLQEIYLIYLDSKNIIPGSVSGNVSVNGIPEENALISFIKEYDVKASFEMRTDMNGDYSAMLEPGYWTCRANVSNQSDEKSIQISPEATITTDFAFGEADPINCGTDTLTIIQTPLLNIPKLLLPGNSFHIEIVLPESEFVNSVSLKMNGHETELDFNEISQVSEFGLRTIEAVLPNNLPFGLYDLKLNCTGTDSLDISKQSVCIIPDHKNEFTFIQVTDTHLPSHYFWGDAGLEEDSTELADFREVINDINIINPDFVVHTGDLINDGEIEYLGIPSYCRAKKQLYELDVPLFLVAGNHDLGGWDQTPAPDGTARRTWWKYFGWKYLNSTSPTATTTQNYSFNYGRSHFIGLEAYDNYDEWRYGLYGNESFISSQMSWLAQDLADHADDSLTVLFYHYDFKNELNLSGLGVDAAFWGHVHRNNEDSSYPYSVSTGAVCDGGRWYRMIKVRDHEIVLNRAFRAGSNGSNLTAVYHASQQSVRITNNHDIDLNDCLVRFPLEKNRVFRSLTNASLFQIDSLADPRIVYAYVDVPANSQVEASIQTDTLEISATEPLPETHFLLDLYPNPFNPALTIEYQISHSSKVNIVIYDLQGMKVKTLFGSRQDPGTYSLTWNAADQPSGVYFIKGEIEHSSGTTRTVKKCLLMK